VTPGFQIITYTGDGVPGRNIAHTLGKKPTFAMIKRRDAAAGAIFYHEWVGYPAAPETGGWPFGNAQTVQWLSDVGYFNNTAPTAAQITLGNSAAVNAAGGTYVMYVWTDVPGFFRTGYYDVDGLANGPLWFTDVLPRMAFSCETNTLAYPTGSDSSANPRNPHTLAFRVGATGVPESTTDDVDFVSNGVKTRVGTSQINNTSATNGLGFVAWARHPFKHARAR